MRHKSRLLKIVSIMTTIVAASCVPVWAASDDAQAWLSTMLVAHPTDRDMIILMAGQRFRPVRGGGDQQVAYAVLEHSLDPHFQIGTMAYYRSDPEQEVRVYEQFSLGNGPFTIRTRLEQRNLDANSHISWRLRQRFRMDYPLDRDGKTHLIAAAEFFVHLNRPSLGDKLGLAVTRYQLGVNRQIAKDLEVQLVYLRQQSYRDRAPDAVIHVPWLTLRWNL